MESGFKNVSKEIAGVKGNVKELHKDVKTSQRDIKALNDKYEDLVVKMSALDSNFALGRSVTDTLATIRTEVWARSPDLTVFKVNTERDTAREVVFGGLEQWLLSANVAIPNAVLEGPPEGRRFLLRFNHGDEGHRVRFATQAAGALRSSTGKWLEFSCPTGRIYVDRDKNDKRLREEMVGLSLIHI